MTRILDVIIAAISLVILPPLIILIAIWVKLDSRGPVFYRQTRVGKAGKDFTLYKFRTLVLDSDKKGLLTIGGKDNRITKAGLFLRKYKIDELPQIVNVLVGDMSFVGPRPEVRKYVQLYTEDQKKVLSVPPGITDMASIIYYNENDLLANAEDPEEVYIRKILPDKIRLNMYYIEDPSVTNYFKITWKTIEHILK